MTEPDPGVLFLTADGTVFSLDRLTQLARDYVTASGVGKQGACHLFRHTMATLMLEGGADIRYIQAMLGHAELSTTQIYTQVSIRTLQAVHAATHPGADLARHRAALEAQVAADQHHVELHHRGRRSAVAVLRSGSEIEEENRPHPGSTAASSATGHQSPAELAEVAAEAIRSANHATFPGTDGLAVPRMPTTSLPHSGCSPAGCRSCSASSTAGSPARSRRAGSLSTAASTPAIRSAAAAVTSHWLDTPESQPPAAPRPRPAQQATAHLAANNDG